MEGINSRMDGLQASLLTAKLEHIDDWTMSRRRVAALYDAALRGVGDLELPKLRAGATHVYHLYVVASSHRDALRSHLLEHGVETAVHYPTALPLLPVYARFGLTAADFPNAARNQQRILSLPIYPEISEEQVEYVADAIRKYFASR
jgi:dTDP-4-amino-4,6-dideoxygalactose transaminase